MKKRKYFTGILKYTKIKEKNTKHKKNVNCMDYFKERSYYAQR